MKLIVLAVLALCLAGGCCRDVETNSFRQLLKRASASSSSTAKSTEGQRAAAEASARSTEGTAEAVATATSEAFTEISNQLVEYFKYVGDNLDRKRFSETEEDYCENALAVIEKELEAVGSVTASTYTETMAQVEITGTGEACSAADASAEAQATGYSKILVDAITEASIGVSEARAEAAVEVVSEVIAGAFASAFSTACLKDEGQALALQTSFAEAVAMPIATVSVLAASGVDCTGQKGYARSEVEGEAKSEDTTTADTTTITQTTGEAIAEAGGEAEAFTGELTRCFGIHIMCCGEAGDVCTCSRTKTARCHAEKKMSGTTMYWSDAENEVYCTCERSKSLSFSLIVV